MNTHTHTFHTNKHIADEICRKQLWKLAEHKHIHEHIHTHIFSGFHFIRPYSVEQRILFPDQI